MLWHSSWQTLVLLLAVWTPAAAMHRGPPWEFEGFPPPQPPQLPQPFEMFRNLSHLSRLNRLSRFSRLDA